MRKKKKRNKKSKKPTSTKTKSTHSTYSGQAWCNLGQVKRTDFPLTVTSFVLPSSPNAQPLLKLEPLAENVNCCASLSQFASIHKPVLGLPSIDTSIQRLVSLKTSTYSSILIILLSTFEHSADLPTSLNTVGQKSHRTGRRRGKGHFCENSKWLL